ncbi:MAG: nucleotidyltransferase family protein [Lachnospiraceae bacterium]|nr:nucleotidyltransferase family protein [Lachnospiraceae bacterium]
MQKVQYDMIYLAACGVNQRKPDIEYLQKMNMEWLYKLCHAHQIDALAGMTIIQAGEEIPKEWNEQIGKAIRKNILFDAERAKILQFMEQNEIWYLPLKGIVMKELYPAVGMRQMSDNDILFDEVFADKLQAYMESLGYKSVAFGKGNHDVYKKAPVYNFEMHRTLYNSGSSKEVVTYYKRIKEKLLLNEGSEYGYHFRDEDFYIYMLFHMYKHYSGGGTGIRSLLDLYVFLKKKEAQMDFSYIEQECKLLKLEDFEKQNRELCKKVFTMSDVYEQTALEQLLVMEEKELLDYYLSSGVHGTQTHWVKNNMKNYAEKSGKNSKIGYLKNRLFPDAEFFKSILPWVYKHKWLLPVGWIYRIILLIFDPKRRKKIEKEVKIVRNSEKQ